MSVLRQGESGSVELSNAVTLAPALLPWQRVASYRANPKIGPEPKELILNVTVLDGVTGAPGLPPRTNYTCMAGQYIGAFIYEPPIAAVVRITYGAGAVARQVYMDLAPGRYYLGPVEQVTVEVIRWRIANTQQIGTLRVDAAIVDAAGGMYDEPTYTVFGRNAIATRVNQVITAPPSARWFTPLLATYPATNTAFWGDTTLPKFCWDDGGSPVTWDPATPAQWNALARYELAASGPLQGLTYVNVYNPTVGVVLPIEMWSGVRFYLAST